MARLFACIDRADFADLKFSCNEVIQPVTGESLEHDGLIIDVCRRTAGARLSDCTRRLSGGRHPSDVGVARDVIVVHGFIDVGSGRQSGGC